jgi:hypothetical protein
MREALKITGIQARPGFLFLLDKRRGGQHVQDLVLPRDDLPLKGARFSRLL